MIYLALLLILCGVLILITALSVETGKFSAFNDPGSGTANKHAGYHNDDLPAEDIEIIFPGDRIDEADDHFAGDDVFISFDDDASVPVKPGRLTDNDVHETVNEGHEKNHHDGEAFYGERRRLDSTGRPDIIEKRANTHFRHEDDDFGFVSAVMFDDRSNIIDYESGSGVIDSTLSKYKSIKRIGKGRIESDFDGVNFYLDEKLYRFDFHKVYDIWSGSNYIALPLKGNSTVKLFIIENSAGFPDKVEADFKEYEKGL